MEPESVLLKKECWDVRYHQAPQPVSPRGHSSDCMWLVRIDLGSKKKTHVLSISIASILIDIVNGLALN